VPKLCGYKEIFNSDDTKYGGSGVINKGIINADAKPWDSQPYSIGMKVPPLAVSILKLNL